MGKLTPMMQRHLDRLKAVPHGEWLRLDKSIGDALVRRGVAQARRNETTRHHEYRLSQWTHLMPPEPPKDVQGELFG